MATLIIADIDSMGNMDREFFTAETFEVLTELLRAELENTACTEFVDYVMDMWTAERYERTRPNFAFTVSNTASEVRLTDKGTRVRFTYLA